jgi:regulator of protease activity HflC (stomatin/prohibitin superfamily)
MRPVNRQFNRFEARGSQVVQGWINTGRTEEYLSRTLVEETTTEIIEETLDYMAVSPELDQLVEAQSQEIAGEVVGEIQERTNRIFIFGGLFRRNQTK